MQNNRQRWAIDRCVDMALELFNHDTQDLILIEEMSELTKALLKRRRGKDNDAELIEEMAHVLISFNVIQTLYGISDEDLCGEAVKKLKKYGRRDISIAENRLLPVTKAPEKVRLGDYTGGLFDFDGMVYVKANATPRFTCFDIINGNVRRFDADILVTPLEVWEVDGGEDE